MATHSSILAWRIPGTVEPGGLPSMGSHRVRHDQSDLAAAAAAASSNSSQGFRPDPRYKILVELIKEVLQKFHSQQHSHSEVFYSLSTFQTNVSNFSFFIS